MSSFPVSPSRQLWRGWSVRGESELLGAVGHELDEARRARRKEQGVFEAEGRRWFFKYGPLHGKSRLRHAMRSAILRSPVPMLREFDNLSWLRRNGFGAPLPAAAGVFVDMGLPAFQFLYTEEIPEARTLRQVFEEGPHELREPALQELGTTVARVHSRRFVHHDLFPRNLLVTETAGFPRIHFLDAWSGGPAPGLRGPTYDLACLMLFGVDLFDLPERGLFFDTYFGERERLGAVLRRESTLRSVVRQRRRLARRYLRRRRPESSLAAPPLDWTP